MSSIPPSGPPSPPAQPNQDNENHLFIFVPPTVNGIELNLDTKDNPIDSNGNLVNFFSYVDDNENPIIVNGKEIYIAGLHNGEWFATEGNDDNYSKALTTIKNIHNHTLVVIDEGGEGLYFSPDQEAFLNKTEAELSQENTTPTPDPAGIKDFRDALLALKQKRAIQEANQAASISTDDSGSLAGSITEPEGPDKPTEPLPPFDFPNPDPAAEALLAPTAPANTAHSNPDTAEPPTPKQAWWKSSKITVPASVTLAALLGLFGFGKFKKPLKNIKRPPLVIPAEKNPKPSSKPTPAQLAKEPKPTTKVKPKPVAKIEPTPKPEPKPTAKVEPKPNPEIEPSNQNHWGGLLDLMMVFMDLNITNFDDLKSFLNKAYSSYEHEYNTAGKDEATLETIKGIIVTVVTNAPILSNKNSARLIKRIQKASTPDDINNLIKLTPELYNRQPQNLTDIRSDSLENIFRFIRNNLSDGLAGISLKFSKLDPRGKADFADKLLSLDSEAEIFSYLIMHFYDEDFAFDQDNRKLLFKAIKKYPSLNDIFKPWLKGFFDPGEIPNSNYRLLCDINDIGDISRTSPISLVMKNIKGKIFGVFYNAFNTPEDAKNVILISRNDLSKESYKELALSNLVSKQEQTFERLLTKQGRKNPSSKLKGLKYSKATTHDGIAYDNKVDIIVKAAGEYYVLRGLVQSSKVKFNTLTCDVLSIDGGSLRLKLSNKKNSGSITISKSQIHSMRRLKQL